MMTLLHALALIWAEVARYLLILAGCLFFLGVLKVADDLGRRWSPTVTGMRAAVGRLRRRRGPDAQLPSTWRTRDASHLDRAWRHR